MIRFGPRRPGRAFTLVEVIIVLGIVSVVMYVVYRIWSGIARGGTTEAWATDVQARMGRADTTLRELLAKAGYPAMVTPQGQRAPASTDPYRVQVSGAAPMVDEAVAQGGLTQHFRVFDAAGNESPTAGTAVLGFWAVVPGCVGIEGKKTGYPTGSRIRLLLARGHLSVNGKKPLADLVLEDSPIQYAGTPGIGDANLPDPGLGTAIRRMLIPDVSRIRISASTNTNAQPVEVTATVDEGSPATLRIEVECLESYHGTRRAFRRIVADTRAGLRMDGTP